MKLFQRQENKYALKLYPNIIIIIFLVWKHDARRKTNANYGNLVFDKVEKRVAKNLFYDSCFTISSWAKKDLLLR